MERLRLDVFLSEKGLTKSRQRAKELIIGGQVRVNGIITAKPSFDTGENDEIEIVGEQLPYVGKGGLKLEKAIKVFGIDLNGKVCIDIGASTGGFTDCMLQSGAEFVYAVDVGHGQLDEKLRSDVRVKNMEGTNILDLTAKDFSNEVKAVSFISADVSFISLKKMIPKINELLPSDGEAAVLIKPQFEAGRSAVGKGGIVKDRKIHEKVLNDILAFLLSEGLYAEGITYSPICGGDGNIEYLAHIKKGNKITAHDCGGIVSEAFGALK